MKLEQLAEELGELVLRAVPKSKTVSKYGGTLYTLKPDEKEGQYCGVFIYKDHVQLAFSEGTSLDDASQVLQGTGKNRRHINFKQSADIDSKVLNKLLKQAAKNSTE